MKRNGLILTTSLILDDGPHGLNGTHEGKREIRITNIHTWRQRMKDMSASFSLVKHVQGKEVQMGEKRWLAQGELEDQGREDKKVDWSLKMFLEK